MITLVLGGARSGKSRMAESLCVGERHYIATAQAFDDEMRERIAKHQKDRGADWITHEAPIDLVGTLKIADGVGQFVLVDCLTLWLTNLLLDPSFPQKRVPRLSTSADAESLGSRFRGNDDIEGEVGRLTESIGECRADIILVSNEVGLGIVPDNALARRFRDLQGMTNQRVAAVADRVIFMAAGLPMVLKGSLPAR